MSERTLAQFARHLLIPLVLAAPVVGQVKDPETVPIEFARMFLGMPFDGPLPDLLVGQLHPALLEVAQLPTARRVIGSVVSGGYSMNAFVVAGAPDQVRRLLSPPALGAGWRVLERQGMTTVFDWSGSGEIPDYFCLGDSLSVSSSVFAARGDSSYVMLMYRQSRDESMCRSVSRPNRPWDDLPLPKLGLPPGAIGGRRGSGGGGEEWREHAEMISELEAGAILNHYAASLETQGWAEQDRAVGGRIAAAGYAHRDQAGVAWTALLVITADEGGPKRRVTFQLTKSNP